MLARSLRIESKIMEIYLNLNPDQAGMSEGERTGLCTCIRHLGSTF